jgi:two-component system response regulator AtoC
VSARVLVVDDEEGVREYLAEALELAGHEVEQAGDGEAALARLRAGSFHLVLTDLKMPRLDGLGLLDAIQAETPETEVVVLTAHGTIETAVDAMRRGAFDYLQKPIGSPKELRLVVERALERRSLKDLRERSRRDAAATPVLSWGAPAMAPVVHALERVAPTPATVLLLGESGTGKEVAARTLHARSPRAAGPFVAVNCAALTETLLESELFGHERGAFTGAHERRRGRLELAQGGTFFLDEVGELQPSLQAKLLRVLQERRFERLGGGRSLEADVRWVAATNRDLPAMIAEGRFREDLYHRLAVFPIELPPLRARPEDVPPLARHLLAGIAAELGRPQLTIGPEVMTRLHAHVWPGNVRELRNVLERACILADGDVLQPAQLWLDPQAERAAERSEAKAGGSGPPDSQTSAPIQPLAELEREAIERALAACDGNRTRAAEQLGIGVRTLYEKLKRYEAS